MELVAMRLRDYLEVHKDLYFPHRHSFYQIVVFTQGGGQHAIDFQNHAVVPGQVYAMSPGQIHVWKFSDDTDGYILNFNESFYTTFLQNAHYLRDFPLFHSSALPVVSQLDAQSLEKVTALVEAMLEEERTNEPFKMERLRSLLTLVMIEISRVVPPSYRAGISPHHLSLMRQFEHLIEEHFYQKRLPKEYAELLFISPNYLNTIAQATLGISAGDLIRERVILEIKRLLANSDLLISQIADRLHFDDNAYFTRFFKKYTGYTPEVFRANFLRSLKG